MKNKTIEGHSELGSESSAFDFCKFFKALDAETIPDQVRDSMTIYGGFQDNAKMLQMNK